ncbi:MAG: universal stress protein [Balneolaceae bacterium]
MYSIFKHAVVALDLSEASELIVDCVSTFQKLGTRKLTLVTVIPVPHGQDVSELDTSEKHDKLEVYKKQLEERGFEVDIHIRAGIHYYPPAEIVEAAEDVNADFIVISNRGSSKVVELKAGGTSAEVMQRSRFPVYLINIDIEKGKEDPNKRLMKLPHPCENALDHVLYATDFSDNAYRTYKILRNLEGSGAVKKISIIHVQGDYAIALKDPISRDDLNAKNREQLDKIRNKFSDRVREDVDLIITYGTPFKEIVEKAEEVGATMIMMGSQGEGFEPSEYIGGVSSKVTRLSKFPVLLISPERESVSA